MINWIHSQTRLDDTSKDLQSKENQISVYMIEETRWQPIAR